MYAVDDGEEEDLVQEIVTQLWRSFPTYRGGAKVGTWLYRVALNTALTWRRKSKTRRALFSSDGIPAGAAAKARSDHRLEASILSEFLESLVGPDRSVLLLYMEGLPHHEIAEVTGLSNGAVAVRLHRMKRAFTKRYVER